MHTHQWLYGGMRFLGVYFFFLVAFFLAVFSSVAFFLAFFFAILKPPFNQKRFLINGAISINPTFSQLYFFIKLNWFIYEVRATYLQPTRQNLHLALH